MITSGRWKNDVSWLCPFVFHLFPHFLRLLASLFPSAYRHWDTFSGVRFFGLKTENLSPFANAFLSRSALLIWHFRKNWDKKKNFCVLLGYRSWKFSTRGLRNKCNFQAAINLTQRFVIHGNPRDVIKLNKGRLQLLAEIPLTEIKSDIPRERQWSLFIAAPAIQNTFL